MLLQDLLALQAVGALRGRAPGESPPSRRGHPVPGGVSPEGRLVLAGRSLTVHLVLHHGYAVELRAAPARKMGGSTVRGGTVGPEVCFRQEVLKGSSRFGGQSCEVSTFSSDNFFFFLNLSFLSASALLFTIQTSHRNDKLHPPNPYTMASNCLLFHI